MRGYPDFLAVPAYAGFGYLYREYDTWHDIAPGATYNAISISGQGETVDGRVFMDMNAEDSLLLTPRIIVDGTSVDLLDVSILDLTQPFGESDAFYRLCLYRYVEGYTQAVMTIRKGYSWGLSFVLQFFNESEHTISVDTLLYYRKCERP